MTRTGSCKACGVSTEIKSVGQPRKYCSPPCRLVGSGDLGRKHGPYLPPGTSFCRSCSTIKPLEDFHRASRNGRKPKPACKQCIAARRAARTEEKQRALRLELGIPSTVSNCVVRNVRPIGSTYGHKGYIHEKVGWDASAHHRADKTGWVPQHIVVAERKYGFPITEDYTVHHRNRDPSDNRPENLELRVGRHGVGGDVADTLLASEEMRREFIAALERYGYEVIPPAPQESSDAA